ncbi:MAG: hypothetical protein P8R42_12200 [Candidatus Binatia bacterium]|nr:hypothetical protein [Candidatus Binatia bacterium]
MKRPSITSSAARAALFFFSLLGACAAQTGADRLDPLGLVPSPPKIAAVDAGQHVGQLVVVQTKIAGARVERGQAVLKPEGVPSGGLVIVIAPPVVGPRATELAAKYDGQEVRAVGYISDLGNDLELLIGDPGRIRLATDDDAAPAAPAAAGAASERTASAQAAPVVAAAPSASSPPAAVAAPVAAVPIPAPTPDPACVSARAAWQIASQDAQAPLRELLACLGEGEPRCTDAAARARIAMAEVAASEERLRWVCGAGS